MSGTRVWIDVAECPACDGLGHNMDDTAYRCPGCGGSGCLDDYESREKAMTTTTGTDDPFADEEEQEEWEGPIFRDCEPSDELIPDSFFTDTDTFASMLQVVMETEMPPLTVEQEQAEQIRELKAQIESMERDRQVQTVCTTLLQMVVSGSLEYYLSGPGQDTLGALHKITQDASEGMRHLAAQEREG